MKKTQTKRLLISNMIFLSTILLLASIAVSSSDMPYANNHELNASANNPSEIYGLFLGVEDYPGIPNDLNYPVDDIEDMQTMGRLKLAAPWTGTNDYCISLKDEDVTENNISDAFNTLSNKVDENDILFFQYSGHGGRYYEENMTLSNVMESNHNYTAGETVQYLLDLSSYEFESVKLYFDLIDLWGNDNVTIYDAHTGNQLERFHFIGPISGYSSWFTTDKLIVNFTANSDSAVGYGFRISFLTFKKGPNHSYLYPYDSLDPASANNGVNYLTADWLNAKLSMFDCKIIVFIDACHSGGFIPIIKGQDRFVMAAAQVDETALEIGLQIQHGLMTYAILNAYNTGFDPDGDGWTSFKELSDNVTAEVVAISTAAGSVHHVVFDNQIGNDFNLADFQDTDADGYSNIQEIIDGTAPNDPTSNKKQNAITVTGTVFQWIFWIGLVGVIVAAIFLHKNGRKFPLAEKPFQNMDDTYTPGFIADKVLTFNALSIEKQTETIEKSEKIKFNNPLSQFLNRGDSIIIKNPEKIMLPMKCVCTMEPIVGLSDDDFPVQECNYIYPSDSRIEPKDMVDYKIQVPVSEETLEQINKAKEINAKSLQFYLYGLLGLMALWIILSFSTGVRLASSICWLGVLALTVVYLYKIKRGSNLSNYFMATRINANTIELKINNKEYESLFKQINKIDIEETNADS